MINTPKFHSKDNRLLIVLDNGNYNKPNNIAEIVIDNRQFPRRGKGQDDRLRLINISIKYNILDTGNYNGINLIKVDRLDYIRFILSPP